MKSSRPWDKADQTTRDATDLALLTGQRLADVLKIERTHTRPREWLSAWLIRDDDGELLAASDCRATTADPQRQPLFGSQS